MKTLLIIDAQNDFILPDGALPVEGAVEDMQRLIPKLDEFDKIVLTLDSHEAGHIATPVYWTDKAGNHPAPYTIISAKDVEDGIWQSRDPHAADYLKKLEANGKHHTVWPEHCVYGSFGWELYAPLKEAICKSIYNKNSELAIHLKGRELNTEMFSAVMPEVSLNPKDQSEAKRFLSLLENSELIAVAGEAENFCVKETVTDIVRHAPRLASKMEILRDCMSAIPVGDDIDAFWAEMASKGLRIR